MKYWRHKAQALLKTETAAEMQAVLPSLEYIVSGVIIRLIDIVLKRRYCVT
jgi:hypothetical protein